MDLERIVEIKMNIDASISGSQAPRVEDAWIKREIRKARDCSLGRAELTCVRKTYDT